ncbi:hypothetical protein BDV37DRAFT_267363 [Aspergillus pseudonomiae]|uniref:Uncharacterized protein n=1 Tax=Aspergillus pseudonomiae TaxID=1506151 RepID=A0A5N7CSY6_9EURO|nr:uncharacterized protein BDV37DRAFT_267363 [Aspergillus pseudonomiae]KAE8396797.1 hypothetical protein BDV37DRAFT_267363 [Aspergillus pseudonomiae]
MTNLDRVPGERFSFFCFLLSQLFLCHRSERWGKLGSPVEPRLQGGARESSGGRATMDWTECQGTAKTIKISFPV